MTLGARKTAADTYFIAEWRIRNRGGGALRRVSVIHAIDATG